MDALNRMVGQLRTLYGSMSASQRMTLVLLPVLLVAAFGFLMMRGWSDSYVAVSWGKTFTTPELINAEQAFHDAGLTEYQREGQRLMAPKGEVERYNAALLEGGGLPTDWASELEKKIENSGPFTSKDKLQAMKDALLGKELSRMIRALPDIDDARVIWAPATKRRWPRNASRVTATVNVLPRRGRDLNTQVVRSLRVAVASAIPELSSGDVVVFDQRNGKAYTPDKEGDPFNSRLLTRINQLTEMYHGKIADALGYIDDVLITVNVDLENLKSHVVREQSVDNKKKVELQQSEQRRTVETSQQALGGEPGAAPNVGRSLQTAGSAGSATTEQETSTSSVVVPSFTTTQKEFIPAMPKAVQVSVQIPEEYLQKALAQSSSSAEGGQAGVANNGGGGKTREAIMSDVRATVAKAIGADSEDQSIVVSSYVRVPREQPEVNVSWTETVTGAAGRWGGAIGLALFALWALRMLYKTMPELPEAEPGPSATPRAADVEEEEDEENPEPQVPEANPRDQLQLVVRDNPEMAATVLSKWIQTGK